MAAPRRNEDMSKEENELDEYVREKRAILLEDAEKDLAALPGTIETCFTHSTQRLLAMDLGQLALKFALIGSMYARVEQDYEEAGRKFRQVHRLLPHFSSILERFERDVAFHEPPEAHEVLEPLSLNWLMVGCIMADDKEKAKAVAQMLFHPRVRDRAYDYPYERFMAAVVLGDDAKARLFARDTKTPLYRSLNGIGQAILAGAQARFDEVMAVRVADYAHGSRRRTYEEHGWTKNANRSTIDSYGIAYCQLALSRGLKVNIESPYYPAHYLHAWDR